MTDVARLFVPSEASRNLTGWKASGHGAISVVKKLSLLKKRESSRRKEKALKAAMTAVGVTGGAAQPNHSRRG